MELKIILEDCNLSIEAKLVYSYLTTLTTDMIMRRCIYDCCRDGLDFSQSQIDRAFQELYNNGYLKFYSDLQRMMVKNNELE